MKHPHLTECGLPGITHIPYGVHMCNFYRTREELAAALVPFFAAGLRTNERRALAEGYAGLRITGNVTFLRSEDWALFMEYEELVNRAFQGRRIITLCTYQMESCGASEMYDVLRRHNGALDGPDEGWQILTARPA